MRFTFYKFNLGDVDDIDVYAAGPIYDWLQTQKGRWVEENATDLKFYTEIDNLRWGYNCAVCGNLEGPAATEYMLRWHNRES